jgi:hypothetical protein
MAVKGARERLLDEENKSDVNEFANELGGTGYHQVV